MKGKRSGDIIKVRSSLEMKIKKEIEYKRLPRGVTTVI